MKRIISILLVVLALSCTCFADQITVSETCTVYVNFKTLNETPTLKQPLTATSHRGIANVSVSNVLVNYGDRAIIDFRYTVAAKPWETYTVKVYIDGELDPEYTTTTSGPSSVRGAFRTDYCFEMSEHEVKIVVDFEEE